MHGVATREQAATAEAAVVQVHVWNPRKRMFDPRHIHLAWERLNQTGWLS